MMRTMRTTGPAPRRMWTHARGARGQSTVEFSLIALVLLGMLFGVVDLGRIGFARHTLDGATYALATSVTAISNTNSSAPGHGYAPTPLDPTGPASPAAAPLAAAVASAARAAGSGVSSAALTPMGGAFGASTTTLTNPSIAVVGTPNLTAPTEITVSVTETVPTITGLFLHGVVAHVSAHSSTIPASGQ